MQSLPLSFIGIWTVNNKVVEVNNSTKIEGQKTDFKKGSIVELEGYYLNKKFIVKEIETKDSQEKEDQEESDD